MIAVLDFGSAGNTASVANALRRARAKYKVVPRLGDMQGVSGLIIPGVGSFSAVPRLAAALGGKKAAARITVPVLCVCLGMQALFPSSEESPGTAGLGIVKGDVRKIKGKVRLPQLGWNQVRLSGGGKLDPLFAGIKNGEYFYFANSFAAFPKQRNKALCFTSYGQKFASAVREGNFWGVQFHPEKSGKAGQQVIRNFVSICGKNAAIPSIDVMRGKAVRLKQGRRGTEEFFGDPLALAEKYEKAGFPILHIVDLDAAFGAKSQIPLLRRIASQCRGIRVQWGGGIRSVKSARQAFSAGAYRVVFGTAIAVSPKTVRQCAQEFGPDRVSVSLDFAGNPPKLQIKGWKEGADTGLRKAISLAESCCVGGLIISSVDADGMQKGPDLALISKASGIARLPICLAGGIRSPLDAKRALSAGADSVIIGRALYDGMKKSADRLFQQWNYRNSTTRTKSADRLFQRWNIEIPIQK